MFVNKPMLYRKESPEKPQYNMATASFLDKPTHFASPPLFQQKFSVPSISINFEKIDAPSFSRQGGGGVGGSNYAHSFKCRNLLSQKSA